MAEQKVGIQITANDKTKAAFNSVDRNLKTMTSGIMSVKGALVGLLGVGGFTALAVRSLDAADAIAKAAERTGFATDSLQELRYAADQNGASFRDLDDGLARFTKRLGLARMETGAANDTYKKLGIDLSQTNEQVFRQVVDTLASLESQTDRLALTTRLFGDDAQKLELTFRGGTRALDDYAAKAQRLGLVLDKDLLRNAEQANDELSTMKQILDAQFTRAFVELAPLITQVGQAFADAAPHIAAFVSGFGDIEHRSKVAIVGTIETINKNIDETTKSLARAYEIQADPSVRTFSEKLFGPGSPEALKQHIDDLNQKLLELNGRLFRAQERRDALNSPIEITINTSTGVDTSGLYGNETDDKEHEAYLARLQRRYEALNQSLLSERELEIMRADEKRMIFDEMWLNDLITEQDRNLQMETLEQQHQDNLTAINARGEHMRRMQMTAGLNAAASIFGSLSTLMGKEGAKMNAKQKALARLSIITSTAQAVMNALAVPPYPLGLALAAGAALKGAEQLRVVGGGGGSSSVSSSVTETAPVSVQETPTIAETSTTSSVTIQFLGDVYSPDLDSFQEMILDTVTGAVNDRDVIIIGNDSRQAQELTT